MEAKLEELEDDVGSVGSCVVEGELIAELELVEGETEFQSGYAATWSGSNLPTIFAIMLSDPRKATQVMPRKWRHPVH